MSYDICFRGEIARFGTAMADVILFRLPGQHVRLRRCPGPGQGRNLSRCHPRGQERMFSPSPSNPAIPLPNRLI